VIRRKRLYGAILLGFVFTVIGVTALAALVLVGLFPKGHREPEVLSWIAYAGLAASAVVGLPLAFIGQRLHRYAPGVSIVNRGGPAVVFHFASQVYRDHFAALNRLPDSS